MHLECSPDGEDRQSSFRHRANIYYYIPNLLGERNYSALSPSLGFYGGKGVSKVGSRSRQTCDKGGKHFRSAQSKRTNFSRNQCSLPRATSSQATSNQPTSQPPSHPATNPPATHHPPTTPPAPGGGGGFLRHKRHSDGGFTPIPVAGSRFCIKFGVHRSGNPKKTHKTKFTDVLFPACWRGKTQKKNMSF